MATKDQPNSLLSPADIEILTRHYDTNKDGILSEEEIRNLIAEVKKGTNIPDEVASVIKKYDTNNDGSLDEAEFKVLNSDMSSLADSNARYLAYSVGAARIFRYLAFTSGENPKYCNNNKFPILNLSLNNMVLSCFVCDDN